MEFHGTRWMEQAPQELREKPLKDLVIPGSHDAGSGYRLHPILLIKCEFPDAIVRGMAKAQGGGITEQLRAGSRYLDLRGSLPWFLKKKKENVLPNHGVTFYDRPFVDIIREIRYFVDNYPNEVIIVTHWFTGTQGMESHLLEFMRSDDGLGARLYEPDPNSNDAALKSIADYNRMGKNVILSDQNDNNFLNRHGLYDEKRLTPDKVDSLFVSQNSDMPDNKMWIWHIAPPYSTDQPRVSLECRALRMFDFFHRRFQDGSYRNFRINIVNVDFVSGLAWPQAIYELNFLGNDRGSIPRPSRWRTQHSNGAPALKSVRQDIAEIQDAGGDGGKVFQDDLDTRKNGDISEVRIWAGWIIDSIQVYYNGVPGGRHGTSTGGKEHKISVPDEYQITEVEVWKGNVWKGKHFDLVKGLCFTMSPISGGPPKKCEVLGIKCDKKNDKHTIIKSSKGLPLRSISGSAGKFVDRLEFNFGFLSETRNAGNLHDVVFFDTKPEEPFKIVALPAPH